MMSLIIIVTMLLLILVSFIISMLFIYQRKQIDYISNFQKLKLETEKNLLGSKLEIQEETFRNISREIHDNINLSLTLVKLYLNTLDLNNRPETKEKIDLSIELLGQSISNLGDISRGLNADIITQQGLIKALDNEASRLKKTNLYKVEFVVNGTPVFLDAKKELVIFRIVQEALNNIIKHSKATQADIKLHYSQDWLYINVSDNGTGFDSDNPLENINAGLKNMESRVSMLKGNMKINSICGRGTCIYVAIPFE